MTALLSLIALGVGALLSLLGLVLIAPQVRVHQIKVDSPGSWLFRVGMLLLVLALIAARGSDLPRQFALVGQLLGLTGVLGGVITLGHEYRQARCDWPRSLTLQLVALGGLALALASVGV